MILYSKVYGKCDVEIEPGTGFIMDAYSEEWDRYLTEDEMDTLQNECEDDISAYRFLNPIDLND